MKKHSPKDYGNFSVNDFVLDEYFHAWVIKKDEAASMFWNQWLAQHPEKREEVEEAKGILRHLFFSEYTMSGDEISKLWHRIRNYKSETPRKQSTPTLNPVWMKVAASLLVCASILFSYFYFRSNETITYHTAFGETKIIVLPDSSTVTLNSNSTLAFPSNWQSHPVREIWLEGEAFFSVVHKINHQPFKVHTSDGVAVEVLGTTFNVYHRPEGTKVVLNTGKIRLELEEENQEIMMKPGELVEYKDKSFSKRSVNPEVYSAWTEKKLVLDRTSLRDMLMMLQNNYGIEVKVSEDSLLNQTVSGSMPMSEPERMVNQIAQVFQLKVTKRDHKFLMFE